MDRVLGAPTAAGTPLDHYDLGYDEGSATSFNRKGFGFLLDATFAVTRWLVSGASMLVEWAFRFTFADALARPAGQVAAAYQSSVVTRLGLTGLAWFAAMCWTGFHTLRGRMTKGMGELAVSFILAVVAVTFFAAPSSTLLGPGGALDRTRQVSLEVADSTTTAPGTTPATGTTTSGRLTASLRSAFVEQPHQMLNWGVVLDDGDPAATPPRGPSRPACLAAYRSLIASGPHGTDDEPRKTMTEAGCEDLAKFNHNPTPDRLVAAALVLLAAVLICLLMIMVAITLAAAQLGLAALVVLAPFALTAGIIPGGGRSVLIRWAAAAAKSLAAVVMTSVFLGLLLVTVNALVAATNGQPLLIRMGVLDLVVVCAFVARSRLLRAGKRAATNAGKRLEGAKIGGSQGRSWLAPAAAGGAAGLGASELGHEMAAQVRQIPDRVGSAGRRLAAVTGRGSYRTRVVGRGAAGAAGAASGPSRGPGSGTGPAGPAGTAPGGPRGGAPSAAAAAGLRARLGGSRSGRAVRAGGAAAVGAVKLGLASTLGAPVYLPRATRAAKAAATAKKAAVSASAARGTARARAYTDDKVATAGAFRDEYAGNVRAAAGAATRAAVRVDAGAAKVAEGAARVAAPARRAGANAAQAARESTAGTKVAAGATRVAAPARRAGATAAQAARTSAAAHAPGRKAAQRRAGQDLGRQHAADELRRWLDSRRRSR
ncbi:MAG: hypothetical protein ACLGIO_07915 [Acidimicrobiia bacterium]